MGRDGRFILGARSVVSREFVFMTTIDADDETTNLNDYDVLLSLVSILLRRPFTTLYLDK